jgi:DNA-directed RNA polymerase specialized sigma24 family protein
VSAVEIGHQGFEAFVETAEPRLRRALLGAVGVDRMPDAVGEALAYGWEHWARVSTMDNPVGYLFRVGQSRTKTRRHLRLPLLESARLPEVEPGLSGALLGLPATQRTAVWLAHGCGWSHSEISVVLDVSTSTVSTHVNRALASLRTEIGVETDA